jgi:hypothetical protein
MCGWAVGIAEDTDPDAVRDDVLGRIESGHGWAPGLSSPSTRQWNPEGGSTWRPPTA